MRYVSYSAEDADVPVKRQSSPIVTLGGTAPASVRFLLAVTYGLVLSQIPGEHFKDFANYLIYAERSAEIAQRFWGQGLLPFVINEPLWLLTNILLGAMFPPDTVVRLIIFISATIVAWKAMSVAPGAWMWVILFLLLPWVIKNHLIHLRQGLGIAVFLWAWFLPRGWLRYVMLAATPLVHASFFFILTLVALSKVSKMLRLAADLRLILVIFVGIFVGMSLGLIAGLLGARQGEQYAFQMTDVSGVGFLFWGVVMVLFLLQGRTFLRRHGFETGLIAFYLSTYWLIEVTARIFESGVLLVLLAGLGLSGARKIAFIGALVSFGGLSWLLRVSQPYLGFGI